MQASFFLRLYECCLTSVILGPSGEVNPIAPLLAAFDEQFIVIPFRAVCDIHQYVRIAQRLLDAHTSDIHRASRQMITRWRPAHCLIHLR